MLLPNDREQFAISVMEEVRRWPGVEMRPHPSPITPGEDDGIEFRLFGRQIGHVHGDCSVHLAFTKALKAVVLRDRLAEPLSYAPTSGWAAFSPGTPADSHRAIWLLRLNYVRLRHQRLTPLAASTSELLRTHIAALGSVSPSSVALVQRNHGRGTPQHLPVIEA